MRTAANWKDYRLLDCSGGEKLEQWGRAVLIRPDPQIIWNTPRLHPAWKRADARYHRSQKGGGSWEFYQKLPENWIISYRALRFRIQPTGFKHTGLFPEQAVNWDWLQSRLQAAGRPVKILNLFAYTGGATLACAKAGASVVHVDASKGMTAWAKENARLSGLESCPIRFLVDDCEKFVERELRRGNRYDGVIMDPPSYGRGPNGQVWRLEEMIYHLIERCALLLSEKPLFFLLNSYTTGLSPSVMAYLLGSVLAPARGGAVQAEEIGLSCAQSGLSLPCGSTAVWTP